MVDLHKILNDVREFQAYLEKIDLANLGHDYTREDLLQLSNDFYSISMRSMGSDLKALADEMKLKEYPELLGVHQFPVLKEIAFMSEEEKIELDTYLSKCYLGYDVTGFGLFTFEKAKKKQLKEWLIEKNVINELHVVVCPHCLHTHVSKQMTAEQKDHLQTLFSNYKNHGDYDAYEELDNELYLYCTNCEQEIDLDYESSLEYRTINTLIAKRNKRLDNI